MEQKKRVAFKTLGCRLNQFETGSLATQFKSAGYELVKFNEPADVYIVNTCTVTNQSDHKSRNVISQAERRVVDPVVVVTGCMAESSKQKLLADDKVTYVVSNDSKSDIFSVVDAHFKGEAFKLPENRNVFDYKNPEKIYKTRGTIKIQDGCDNYCTFCIIPFVRGRAISRPINEILENARQLIKAGYHELVITGVNIGRYKHEDYKFEDLIESLLNLDGDFRLRISSMEPEGIGEKFIGLIDHPKMTPHLHLCLQSGSDKILIKMRRMYDTTQFLSIVNTIREKVPDFNFTTDIMVGFPGETEEDFQDSLSMIKKVGFGHVHTFKYSIRSGTRAERMEDQVSDKLKNERSLMIRDLSEELMLKKRSDMIGSEQVLLAEKKSKNGLLKGYGEHYYPIALEGKPDLVDTFVKVKIKSLLDDSDKSLLAELI